MPAAAPELSTAPSPSSGKPLKILIVEDHEETVTYLSRYLQDEGHEVLVARNASQALETLRGERPDLLLCDILLPDRNGWDLVNSLGNIRPRRCVAMSVRGEDADLARSQLAGFDHHLTKPFLPEHLAAVLDPF